MMGDGRMGLFESPDKARIRFFSGRRFQPPVLQFFAYGTAGTLLCGVYGDKPHRLIDVSHFRAFAFEIRVVSVIDALAVIEHPNVKGGIIDFNGRLAVY